MAARIQQHPAAFVGAAVVVGGSLVAPGVTAWVSAARGGAPNLRDGRQNAVRYGVTVEDRLSLGTASPAASSSRAGEALLVGIAGLSLAARAAAKKRRSGVSRRVVASRESREPCDAEDAEAAPFDFGPELLEAPFAEEDEAELCCVEVSRGQLLRSAGLAAAVGSAASLTDAGPAEAEDNFIQKLTGTGADAAAAEKAKSTSSWVQYDLNTGETLYDIDFDQKDPSHGFVVGARGLFYETRDGGKRWVSRSFANLGKSEDIQYRFQTVSVRGNDVWIVGKPALLLHSKDSGKSWKKVPLSRKLPGIPTVIVALGDGKAELATTSGAVYQTENDGRNWKSQVKETVDATLNRVSASGVQGASYFTGSVKSIKRDPLTGKYLAVAQRGNFYLSFNPGEPRWVPHNRISARRIQAMGFRNTGNGEPWIGAWMTLNGGYLTQCTQEGYDNMGTETKDIFKFSEIRTGGIGLIDLAFRTPTEGWAVGGSAAIYNSFDGGKNWKFDPAGNSLPCNLYNVKFFDEGKVGFMIGSAGILLRRQFGTPSYTLKSASPAVPIETTASPVAT